MPQLARLSAILLALFAFAQAVPSKPNATVITVAGKAIKKSQIDTLASLMARAQGVQDPEKIKVLEKLVATNLIGQELLDKEAKALKVEAAPTELDSALKGLKAGFPNEEAFKKALVQAGDTEAKVKEKIARQIRADKVLAAQVDKPEMPTEAEMKAFWEKNKAEFPTNDSLRALQIMLMADSKTPAAKANEAKAKLETLRQELSKDTVPALLLRRFMTEAARQSQGPEAKTGGDLQRFHPNDFNPEFRKQVKALRVGQLSPVFRTPVGFHLVMLIEKYDGKYDSYKLQVMQNLMAQKTAQTGAALRKLLKSLAAKYPVKYLDAAYRDSSPAGLYN